ncbi:MAG: hypothetical protein ACRC1T_07285 [Clostridium chrysemydis]|uniref:hypothetical protein n=1 Tax=Clostridium chrysemydis TaxID=2665504 RepID=UPI003F3565AD
MENNLDILFKVKYNDELKGVKGEELIFTKEDYLDDIEEYEDIIPIISEMQDSLEAERITCTSVNDECCGISKDNYIIEVHGYINDEDEFITKEELEKYENVFNKDVLDLFVIRVYKCVDCGKWIIDILE